MNLKCLLKRADPTEAFLKGTFLKIQLPSKNEDRITICTAPCDLVGNSEMTNNRLPPSEIRSLNYTVNKIDI